MRALLMADREPGDLAPLCGDEALAMLPVLDKPLVVHAVEALAAVGVTELVVAVSHGAQSVERELGDGTRFGMSLRTVFTRGDERPEVVVRRVSEADDREPWLVLEAHWLRSGDLAAFLEIAEDQDETLLRATLGGEPCGLWRLDAEVHALSRDVALDGRATAHQVDSPAALLEANRAALAGEFEGLLLPGRETVPGVRERAGVSRPATDAMGNPVFLGQHARVATDSELGDGSIIGEHVVIEGRAAVRHSLVLPHTYVGPMVELDQAIVRGSTLVRVDTGAVAQIDDPALLADLGKSAVRPAMLRVVSRVVGCLALVVSAPLWPVMLFDAVAQAPGRPLRRVALLGSRRVAGGRREAGEIPVLESASTIPVLRFLPRLLAVAKGDLALVGVRPLPSDQRADDTDEWARVRDRAPAGLVGPGVLAADADAAEEERLLLEAFYAETRSVKADTGWLLKGLGALFGKGAWTRRAFPVGASTVTAPAQVD